MSKQGEKWRVAEAKNGQQAFVTNGYKTIWPWQAQKATDILNALQSQLAQAEAKAALADEIEERARGKAGLDPLYLARIEGGWSGESNDAYATLEEWGIGPWLARYDALTQEGARNE